MSAFSNISCRPRVEHDLAGLIALWVAAWHKAMPQIDFEARRGWFEDYLKDLEAQGFITICAIDPVNAIIGFVTVHPAAHELDQIAVAPFRWGSGVAQLLLEEARRISPQELILDVNCDNPRALGFYEREGFRPVGEGVNAISGLKIIRMRWTPTFATATGS